VIELKNKIARFWVYSLGWCQVNLFHFEVKQRFSYFPAPFQLGRPENHKHPFAFSFFMSNRDNPNGSCLQMLLRDTHTFLVE